MSKPPIDARIYRYLLLDWVARLAREAGWELKGRSGGGGRFRLGETKGFHVEAIIVDQPPFLSFAASDAGRQTELDTFVQEAVARSDRQDFGGTVWYSTELREEEFSLSARSMIGGLLQRLGGQTRIRGWRRLGRDILLEFSELEDEDGGDPKKGQLLAPRAAVQVHVAAPGPIDGRLSSHIAHGVIEVIAAICAFALGRSVSLPHAIFPTPQEDTETLAERRLDNAILTLARRGVSLDLFTPGWVEQGRDFFPRARSALLTHEAALSQDHSEVAGLLYVVSMECLAVPNAPWRKDRVIKRFCDFLEPLIESELDETVAGENFESVFRIRRGNRQPGTLRRELLQKVYTYRSNWVHEGLDPTYAPMGVAEDVDAENRRSTLRHLSERAIVAFLASPRSSLIGHPQLYPAQP